jgi:hypothetical protein
MQSLDSLRAHALPSDAMIVASATQVNPANQNTGNYSLVESANALTLTTTGSVPVVTQSPFADLYKEGSLYFNGTVGNYVSATATGLSGTQWNTTGMTVEAWVNYPTFTGAQFTWISGLATSTLMNLTFTPPTGSTDPRYSNLSFGVTSSGNVMMWYVATDVTVYSVTSYTQISLNTWNHIALSVAPAGSIYLFVNGVQSQVQENLNGTLQSASYNAPVRGTPKVTSTNSLVLGQFNSTNSTAYLADLRLTTGAGLYTGSTSSYATFTVPSAPLSTSATGVTQALIRAGSNAPYVSNGALTFDRGLKQYMNFGPQTFNIATRGFTAVFRYTWNGTVANNERLFQFTQSTSSPNNSFAILRNGTGSSVSFSYYNNSGTPTTVTTTGTLSQSVTYVLALVYSGGSTIQWWVNGAPNASGTLSLSSDPSLFPYTFVGCDHTGASSFTSLSSNTLAIYNRALSNVEIYNSYLALTTTPATPQQKTLEIGDINGTPALSVAGDGKVSVQSVGLSSNVLPWPPAAMTGYDTVINGQVYKARASNEYNDGASFAWYAFDKNGGTRLYSSTTYSGGAYTGAVRTTDVNGSVFLGEWVQIQLPSAITLSSYTLTSDGAVATPSLFWVLGSRDGVNWFLVNSQKVPTPILQSTFTAAAGQSFNYFRLVIGTIYYTTGSYGVNVTELTLYGTADTSPALTIAPATVFNTSVATPSLTGIAAAGVYTPQDFSSSGLNIPAYVVSNTATLANTVQYSSMGPFAGEGSLYFPGGLGAYVNFPSSAVTLWPGGGTLTDGTIEMWVYITQFNSSNSMFFNRGTPAGASPWYLAINSGGLPYFAFNNGSGTTVGAASSLTTNSWNHIAVTVKSNIITVFLNGVPGTTGTFSGTLTGTSAYSLYMSNYQNGSAQTVYGYTACARIVSGQALYTTSFTPPTGPLQPIQGVTQAGLPYGTVLLLRNAPAPGRVLTSKFGGANSGQVLAFPPAAMTGYSTALNSGYGQGTYIVAASTERTNNNAWMAYNRLFVANGGEWQPSGGYTASNPGPSAYTGTTITVDVNGASYGGEWLQVQLPSSVTASGYTVSVSSSAYASYLPGSWWVLGSRDGTNWYLVSSISNVSQSTFSYINSAYYSVNIPVSSSQAFTYWRLIVRTINGVGSTNTLPAVAGFFINGSIESVNINPDGKVGLGVVNPTRALEVAGDVVCAGTLSAGNPLMFRNRIINGDMRVFQRGTTFSLSGTSATYTLDRWTQYMQSGGTRTTSNVLDVPFRSGFISSANVVATAATTTSEFFLGQKTEMYNVIDFIGSPVTLSFWYKSNRVGNHGVRFNSGGTIPGNADTYQLFTVVNANTWEYKVLTFNTLIQCTVPGPSTWNGDGIVVNIGPVVFNMGSTSIANGDYFTLTGVQLEKGSVATVFEQRPYGVELQLCQRYYQKSYQYTDAPGTATQGAAVSGPGLNTDAIQGTRYTQDMRTTPGTVTIYSTAGTSGKASVFISGTDTAVAAAGNSTQKGFRYVSTSGITVGTGYMYHYIADAEL